MDLDYDYEGDDGGSQDEQVQKPRQLPPDLPTSLDDRRPAAYTPEVEVYDAWRGQSEFLTTAAPTKPLTFNLSLDEPDSDAEYTPPTSATNHGRLNQMLAAQAAHRNEGPNNASEDTKMANDSSLPSSKKSEILQKALNMAASNGDLERLNALLAGPARNYLDVNAPDEEGTAPLIYASCFGHEDVVSVLLDAGAHVDKQDRHQWTALMWATANRHMDIVKVLLERGASPEAKSSSGRTAFDFVAPHSDMSDYLQENGYKIGSAGVGEDFYRSGFSQDRFEEEMAENEMKRRMMMESAMNLEVDIGNLGLDEQPESPDETDDENEFVWDKCHNDQMFVFQESDLPRLLDVVITNMTPQRSHSQKPVPANVIFLSARYAHYHANSDLLGTLLIMSMEKINNVVELHHWDMTVLAFWMSNATLLLHYLKKDAGLVEATTDFQAHIAELINEIFVLIIRDAERRIDKVLDTAMLDHETIPGFEDVHFQNEWKLFRSKTKPKAPEPPERRFRPPSPQQRAKVSPRNVSSLLSSTIFVLDLYDVHSVITTQVLAQLFYWLGSELFNRVVTNRKYMARTKAMQMRMNVSVLEDWARSNNRQPEHYENGSATMTGETTVDAARHHLAPVIQLLQWLQIFSSLGESREALNSTINQLRRLSPHQLIHAVKYYRAEVGEKGLPKSAVKFLLERQKEAAQRKARRRSNVPHSPKTPAPYKSDSKAPGREDPPLPADSVQPSGSDQEDDDVPEHLLFDPSAMLPFSLPTSTDLLVRYGAGFGGVDRERARKYIPTVPPEFLAKLDTGGRKNGNLYENVSLNDE